VQKVLFVSKLYRKGFRIENGGVGDVRQEVVWTGGGGGSFENSFESSGFVKSSLSITVF